MKKKLLIVLLPVVLMVAGAFGVWANEQNALRPGCNNCVKMEQAAPCGNCPNAANMEKGTAPCPKAANMGNGTPCANCPNAANMEKGMPCPNCPNAANMEKGTAPCGNCAKMKGAAAAPPAGNAGCNKCAKMQPVQPMPKGCCNKSQPM